MKDGWETLHKQTDRQTNRHYENNGHLAENQYFNFNRLQWKFSFCSSSTAIFRLQCRWKYVTYV